MAAILYTTPLSICLLAMGGAGPLAPATTALEGRWKVQGFELTSASPQLLRLMHGLNARVKKERAGYLIVRGDRFLPLGNDKLKRAAIAKLDTGKMPKTIDLMVNGRSMKELRLMGIYRLDGDELTLCVGDGATRPIEFKANTGQVLIRYKRIKAE